MNSFVHSSLGAITIVGLLATAARAEWVSYAYSVMADYGFTTFHHPTRAEAEQAALEGCRQAPKASSNPATPAASTTLPVVPQTQTSPNKNSQPSSTPTPTGQSGAPTQPSAQPAPSDCQILLSSAQWLAVAETPNQIYWQEAPTRKLAEEAVLRFCKRREPAQTCQLRLIANGSEGVKFSAYRPK